TAMELELSTPALLFSAITLLMLAYTNRFLALASLIRNLHEIHQKQPGQHIVIDQIKNLKRRLNMIKNMQIFGVISFLLCVVCMFMIYQRFTSLANLSFILSMLALLRSVFLSLMEIQISTKALNIELADMEDVLNSNGNKSGFK